MCVTILKPAPIIGFSMVRFKYAAQNSIRQNHRLQSISVDCDSRIFGRQERGNSYLKLYKKYLSGKLLCFTSRNYVMHISERYVWFEPVGQFLSMALFYTLLILYRNFLVVLFKPVNKCYRLKFWSVTLKRWL